MSNEQKSFDPIDRLNQFAKSFIAQKIMQVIDRRESKEMFTAKDGLESFIYYHAPEKHDSDFEPFVNRLADAIWEFYAQSGKHLA